MATDQASSGVRGSRPAQTPTRSTTRDNVKNAKGTIKSNAM